MRKLKMVKTRSGKNYASSDGGGKGTKKVARDNKPMKNKKTEKTTSSSSSANSSSSSSSSVYRYPKCERHPRGGVMCATCVMAGHTEESYKAYYEKYKYTRALPRRSSGGKAPRKRLGPRPNPK